MIVDLSELRPGEYVYAYDGRLVVVDAEGVAATGATIADAHVVLDAVHEEYALGRRGTNARSH